MVTADGLLIQVNEGGGGYNVVLIQVNEGGGGYNVVLIQVNIALPALTCIKHCIRAGGHYKEHSTLIHTRALILTHLIILIVFPPIFFISCRHDIESA